MTVTTTYDKQGVQVTLVVKDDLYGRSDMTPWDLAQMFIRVIKDTEMNPQMVIDGLKDEFEE